MLPKNLNSFKIQVMFDETRLKDIHISHILSLRILEKESFFLNNKKRLQN